MQIALTMTGDQSKGGNSYTFINWQNEVCKCLSKRKDKYLHVNCKQFIINHLVEYVYIISG